MGDRVGSKREGNVGEVSIPFFLLLIEVNFQHLSSSIDLYLASRIIDFGTA